MHSVSRFSTKPAAFPKYVSIFVATIFERNLVLRLLLSFLALNIGLERWHSFQAPTLPCIVPSKCQFL